MKLISWNCQGAFKNKYQTIVNYKPDILIIPECYERDKIALDKSPSIHNNFLWFGEKSKKGLGILSFNDFNIKTSENHNHDFRYVVPLIVTHQQLQFHLYAIWTNNREDKKNQYIEQVWQAIYFYENALSNNPSILIGDFNSSKIWDKSHPSGCHSDVVSKLLELNIHSVYHNYFNEEQGQETKPTFFFHKDKNKAFHIDYCFASLQLLQKVNNFEIGNYETWTELSDHSPLFVEYDI